MKMVETARADLDAPAEVVSAGSIVAVAKIRNDKGGVGCETTRYIRGRTFHSERTTKRLYHRLLRKKAMRYEKKKRPVGALRLVQMRPRPEKISIGEP